MSRNFTAVSAPITLSWVSKLSHFASHLLANMFLYIKSSLLTNNWAKTMYLLIFQQTSLGILETCQLTGYLPRENSSPICSKFSGKMSHRRWSHFWEKREDCTSWLFFSRRREFNIWDLLVCWQQQWESQQGVVPLFRERKNRERKKKDVYKSEKMILVSKAWDQVMSADCGSESHNKGWYLRRTLKANHKVRTNISCNRIPKSPYSHWLLFSGLKTQTCKIQDKMKYAQWQPKQRALKG